MTARLPYNAQEAIASISEADERIGLLIQLVGPFKLDYRPAQDPFEALCQAVVHQQLSSKAAGTIYRRFTELIFPAVIPTPESVQTLSAEQMKSAGLSGAKTAAIFDLAEKTREGVVPDGESIARMTDEEIMQRLTAVKGVGMWTVEMLLMVRLGRPDILPATDLGIRKGFALLYGYAEPPPPDVLLEHGERWRPYRSVASWYLWRGLELGDGLLPPP